MHVMTSQKFLLKQKNGNLYLLHFCQNTIINELHSEMILIKHFEKGHKIPKKIAMTRFLQRNLNFKTF